VQAEKKYILLKNNHMKLTIISLALLLTSYNAIQKNVGSSLQKTEIEYQIEDILIETRDGVKVSGIGKIVTKENIKDAKASLGRNDQQWSPCCTNAAEVSFITIWFSFFWYD